MIHAIAVTLAGGAIIATAPILTNIWRRRRHRARVAELKDQQEAKLAMAFAMERVRSNL